MSILTETIYLLVGSNKRVTALCANKCEAKVSDSRNIYQGKQNCYSYESADSRHKHLSRCKPKSSLVFAGILSARDGIYSLGKGSSGKQTNLFFFFLLSCVNQTDRICFRVFSRKYVNMGCKYAGIYKSTGSRIGEFSGHHERLEEENAAGSYREDRISFCVEQSRSFWNLEQQQVILIFFWSCPVCSYFCICIRVV